MRVFITGYRGFAGRHLTVALANADATVVTFEGDVREPEQLARAVAAARPDAVAHLAAAASVANAWGREREVWDVNATGTLNTLLAVRAYAPTARVLVVSSAEVYGSVPDARQPIAEHEPLRPVSPYGVSKAAGEIAALASGLDVVVARPFPHIGPGQDERFAVASFAAQIARIERGEGPPVIRVGNLDAVRDLGDVRDTVDAYCRLIHIAPGYGPINVATGHGVRMSDALGILLALSSASIEIQIDPARARAADIPSLVGDAEQLHRATGWKPTRSLETTLGDVLESSRRIAA